MRDACDYMIKEIIISGEITGLIYFHVASIATCIIYFNFS